jgi:oligoendopeptidase F
MYDAIERGEYLDYKTICSLWTKNRDRIYQDAVDFEEVMESEWTMKGHYYIPNFRFYNYPYVYAQLFVYALYQKYIDEGTEFVPKLEKALAAGSSKSPKEIGEILGLDVYNPEFWKLGIKRYENFVNELEKLL